MKIIFGTIIALGAIFLVIVAPIWIFFHYISKMRGAKTITNEDEKTLAEIWDTAKTMETRIQTLEKILDSEHPKWRTHREY